MTLVAIVDCGSDKASASSLTFLGLWFSTSRIRNLILEDSPLMTSKSFLGLITRMPAIAIGVIEQISLQLRETNRKYHALRSMGKDIIHSADKIRGIIDRPEDDE